MTTLYLDLETYSEEPIASGTHVYAAHPSTEILLTAWAIDDGDEWVEEGWSPTVESLLPTFDEIVIHSSQFDRTILRHVVGVELPLSRLHDTLAQARAHGLPGGLDKLGTVFGLSSDLAKDKEGRQLIQLFCKPRPKNMKLRRADKTTHPVEWEKFKGYAASDIRAMRAIRKAMPTWNFRIGSREHELWQLDQEINDRGFRVDLELARGVASAVEREKVRLKAETVELTYGLVAAPTQRDKLLEHLLSFYGVTLPDMRADTLERRIADEELPAIVRELLAIRLAATTTSTAKYTKLLAATSTDGRLRGCLEYAGAARTGRWAGRIFQPQNMPRPDMKIEDIETWIATFKSGVLEYV